MKELLVESLIKSLPDLIKSAKEIFRKNNPTAPEPTDAEVMAAFNQACISTLAEDDAYLAIYKK